MRMTVIYRLSMMLADEISFMPRTGIRNTAQVSSRHYTCHLVALRFDNPSSLAQTVFVVMEILKGNLSNRKCF